MDKLLEFLKPSLPSWMIVPAVLGLLFLLAWPTLRDMWQAIVPSHRSYTAEKRRLELQKLRFEVEELRIRFPNVETGVPEPPKVPDLPSSPLSKRDMAKFGILGSLTAGLLPRLSEIVFMISGGADFPNPEIWFGLAIYAVMLAGISAYFVITLQANSKRDAFIYGLAVPLLFQLITTSLVGPSDKVRQPAKSAASAPIEWAPAPMRNVSSENEGQKTTAPASEHLYRLT